MVGKDVNGKLDLAFGSMIRDRRRALGVTVEQLAEQCDRSDGVIRSIEHGKSEPLLSTALYLCKACGINVGELEMLLSESNIVF